jgi:hypothetical protein
MAKNLLHKYIPDAYKTPTGTVLDSFLAALADEDEIHIQTATETRKELFLTTANGKYLLELASQYGFTVPRQSGFNTEGLRKIAIPAIFLPKQILSTFNAIAESFYVRDVMHPSFQSPNPEPYSLLDGDELSFETESGTTTVVFRASSVADINSVAAGELAGLINAQQKMVFADVLFDRSLNANVLKVSANGYGSNAKIRVSGGSAQAILKFPLLKNASGSVGTQWLITKKDNKYYDSLLTFTWTGAGPNPLCYNLDFDDLVVIRGLTGSLETLNGSFRIMDVGQDYFTITNLDWPGVDGVLPFTWTQTAANEIVFTSSAFRDLYTNQSYAVIAETKIGRIDIYVPILPPIVKRSIIGSLHLHGVTSEVVGLTRNSIFIPKTNNSFPTEGTFILKGNLFWQNWFERYYRYTGRIEHATTFELLLNNDGMLLPVVNDPLVGFGYINPVYCDVDSAEFFVDTPTVHGFETGQMFSIAGFNFPAANFNGNLTIGDFNQSHIVKRRDTQNKFTFEILDTSGNAKKYGGCQIDNIDIAIAGTLVNGANIVLKFVDEAQRVLAGFVDGMRVKISADFGTVLNATFADQIWNKHLSVRAQIDNKVYLVGENVFSLADVDVISAGTVFRSSWCGTTTYRHFLVDPYSSDNFNTQYSFKNMFAVLVGSVLETNRNYVSSYIYDTEGFKFPFIVSSLSVSMLNSVKKYEAPGFLLISEPSSDWPLQGEFYLDYGNDNIEGPISYVFYESAGVGQWRLLINKSYQFNKDHNSGAVIRMARSHQKISLHGDGREYPVYITGVVAARSVMETVMKSVAASGVQLNVIPLKPDIKYEDSGLDPFQ